MAKAPKPDATPANEPVSLEEPGTDRHAETYGPRENPWMRGLYMLIVAIVFWVAQWLLGLSALAQFLWLLIAKERNASIADFGKGMSRWMADAAAFLTAASEEKPFPFKPLGE